jgi:hypothetical protein
LICTACPLKTRGEQRVNNLDSLVKSMISALPAIELFTAKRHKKTGGQQVSAGNFCF